MAPLTGTFIIGPKAQLFVDQTTVTKTATFTQADFQQATGNAQVSGPLSLTVHVDGSLSTIPLFIGITLTTDNGVVTVSDRKHIAFVPPGEQITVSGATVPELSRITDTLFQIAIALTTLPGPYTNQTINVSLRLAPAAALVAPQPYIGADTILFDTGAFQTNNATVSIPANSTLTVVTSSQANATYRTKVRTVSLSLQPTPFPGDLRAYVQVDGSEAWRLFSRTDQYVNDVQMLNLILNKSKQLVIRADNVNSTNAYNVTGDILSENIV